MFRITKAAVAITSVLMLAATLRADSTVYEKALRSTVWITGAGSVDGDRVVGGQGTGRADAGA